MYYRVLTLLAVVTIAYSHDVIVGNRQDGRKIFDENRQASPAIWRQAQNVTVNATDAEVISRIVITDQRPEKDGEAKIVDGGEGQKSVTLELRSPTVLRGYDFHIEVYTAPENSGSSSTAASDKSDVKNPTRVQRNPENVDNTNFQLPKTNFEGTTNQPKTNSDSIGLDADTKVNFNNQKRNTGDISSTETNYNGPKSILPTSSAIPTRNTRQTETRNSGVAPIIVGASSTDNPKIAQKSENSSTSLSNGDLTTSDAIRTARDTLSEDEKNKKTDFLTPLNPRKVAENATNYKKTDEKRAAVNQDDRDSDYEATTPYYPQYHQHGIDNVKTAPTETENRQVRDTAKAEGSSTQTPRLLIQNNPSTKDQTQPPVQPAYRFNNGRTSTTPKAETENNPRRVRQSKERGEVSPPIFESPPETPNEDSRFLFQANSLPLNKSTTTTTSTTAKSEKKRDVEVESPVTRNPKAKNDDDESDDYNAPKAAPNGTRNFSSRSVISIQ